MGNDISRRQATRLLAGSAASLLIARSACAQPTAKMNAMLQRQIPSSGEMLPVIGLGTWRAFDVGTSTAERQPLEEVLTTFVKLGGKLVDSSPMYGRAEGVIGELVSKLKLRNSLFLATKVWTTGHDAGDSVDGALVRPARDEAG